MEVFYIHISGDNSYNGAPYYIYLTCVYSCFISAKREVIAMIWGDIVELRQTNSDIEAELDRMNGDLQK